MLGIFTSAVLLSLLIAAFLFLRKKEDASIYSLPGCGWIIFRKDRALQDFNERALFFLPFLDGNDEEDVVTLDHLLDYLYDSAVPFDDGLKEAVGYFLTADGDEHSFREVIKTASGSLCFVQIHERFDGRYLVTMNDVTRLKNREDSIKRLNKDNYELSSAVEAASSGVVITDVKNPRFPIVFANQSFSLLVQKEIGDIVGGNFSFLLEGFERSPEIIRLFEAVTALQPIEVEVKKLRGDKNEWLHVKLTPVKNDDGDVVLIIAIFSDITDLKVREQELAQAKKLEALGQLATGVAHDFNNVLSIVDGFARLASKKIDDKDEVNNALERIRVASKRGAALTRQMLTFSKHKIIDAETLEIGRIIEESTELLRPTINKKINLNLSLPETELLVDCSWDSISQIVMNLCVNARDAMPDGGDLNLSLVSMEKEGIPPQFSDDAERSLYACLSVADTGVGMTQETLDRVFDPFFTTKGGEKGTGLGMSMVYGIVKDMGGFIDIQSKQGEGTSVSVYMPVSKNKTAKAVVGSADDISALQLFGYTAIVAEDEPDLLALVSEMLEGLGMTVLRAANGNEALLHQDEYSGKIDLLLTDVVMPDLDGIKLAELFQSVDPQAEIIFMSGYPANDKMEDKNLPDNACFVAKPIAYESLAKLVYQRLHDHLPHKKSDGQAYWKVEEK